MYSAAFNLVQSGGICDWPNVGIMPNARAALRDFTPMHIGLTAVSTVSTMYDQQNPKRKEKFKKLEIYRNASST